MSMSDVKEFLVALQKDSEAKEALKQQPKPSCGDEAIAVYVPGGVRGCGSTHWNSEWCRVSDSCSVLITSHDAPPVPTIMECADKENASLHIIPVPGDELTGDTIYTQAYCGCGTPAIDQLKLARLKEHIVDC